jgi:hypothetical protein
MGKVLRVVVTPLMNATTLERLDMHDTFMEGLVKDPRTALRDIGITLEKGLKIGHYLIHSISKPHNYAQKRIYFHETEIHVLEEHPRFKKGGSYGWSSALSASGNRERLRKAMDHWFGSEELTGFRPPYLAITYPQAIKRITEECRDRRIRLEIVEPTQNL